MYIRTIVASAALALTGFSASAQGTTAEALQIAADQGACGAEATIQSAEFIDATTIRVTCLRAGAGMAELGGGLGPAAVGAAGLVFVAIISSVGDGDGSSGTTGTSGTSGT
ncbi:hypothetical protein SAMN05421759_11312 [Roseivivax lentus]|uniref:Uncharacterized protein n=1 Tax=Roseivivax lentus TaxID=633194 RepID=A0A1N7P647_9RHOB|nr:hypothetical protein [Roseivivax lentus]SIT06030.1 hypothetical protein SAMN05421759_11312 [Roseivivax lentus]